MKKLTLYLLLITVLFSCRKDTDIIDPPVGPDPNIIVNASVIGRVVDDNGEGIQDVMVNFANYTSNTDENGFFIISDSELFQDGTHLTAQKDGFITGSRMFYPQVSQSSNIVIQLIEKNIVGNFDSNLGAKVDFDGASIDFPANGFVNEDGSEFNGTVNVIAKLLNPENPSTFDEMPGDLVGVTTESEVQGLATFGMLAVELEDSNGNKLQIKEGSTADIQVPVPNSLLGVAPSEIPLWHFDMGSGYWIEEGQAILVNGSYEGEVSHFSFWNCDAPFPLITLNGTVMVNNIGLANKKITITLNDTGYKRCGFTTDRGFFTGKVPANELLTITVFDECGNVIYESQIGPFSSDTTLPAINVTTINNPVTISGNIDNCTGQTIDQSYASVQFDNGSVFGYPADANGNFSFVIANCNSTEAAVYGVDVTNSLVSEGSLITFVDDVNVGTLTACDTYTTEKLEVIYPGSEWSYVTPSPFQTIMGSYDSQIFPDKVIYNLVYLNWFNSQQLDIQIILFNGAVVAAQWKAEFINEGFEVSGTNAPSGIVTNPQGTMHLLLEATSDNITVTDPMIFDPSITEVSIDLAIPVQ